MKSSYIPFCVKIKIFRYFHYIYIYIYIYIFLQEKSAHFQEFWRILVWYQNILSPKNHTRTVEKTHKNLWTISSSHMWFSVLNCPDIPKLHNAYKKNQQILGPKMSNYVKSLCAKMPWYFHIAYYRCTIKAFLKLLSKNRFYFFFSDLLPCKSFTIF